MQQWHRRVLGKLPSMCECRVHIPVEEWYIVSIALHRCVLPAFLVIITRLKRMQHFIRHSHWSINPALLCLVSLITADLGPLSHKQDRGCQLKCMASSFVRKPALVPGHRRSLSDISYKKPFAPMRPKERKEFGCSKGCSGRQCFVVIVTSCCFGIIWQW